MKIGDILDAIEVTSALPSAFPELLSRAWVTARFGRELVGLHTNAVALGSALLKLNDFFDPRSGLTDDHCIVIPFHEIPRGRSSLDRTALLDHLRWMIDSRRDVRIIGMIVGAVNKALSDRRGRAKAGRIPTLQLERLADDLLAALDDSLERELAMALLTGELHRLPAAIEKLGANKPQRIPRYVRDMMILWGLLDLQIIAARLFHAEWYALGAGKPGDPELVTIRSVRAVLEKFLAAAREFEEAFRTGKDDPKLGAKAKAFLIEHGLEAHALRNAKAMGLSDEEIAPGGLPKAKKEQLKRYLQFVGAGAEVIKKGFDQSLTTASHTRLEYAQMAGQTGKLKVSNRIFDTRADIEAKLEAYRSAATERFSMPVLTSLAYAIKRVTEALSKIPADEGILHWQPSPSDEPTLWRSDVGSELHKELFQIYRHVFVRDHRRLPMEAKKDQQSKTEKRKGGKVKADPAHFERIINPKESPQVVVANGAGLPKQTFSDANLLAAFREGGEGVREGAYIDRLHESSISWRFDKRSKRVTKR